MNILLFFERFFRNIMNILFWKRCYEHLYLCYKHFPYFILIVHVATLYWKVHLMFSFIYTPKCCVLKFGGVFNVPGLQPKIYIWNYYAELTENFGNQRVMSFLIFFFNKHCVLIVTNQLKILLAVIINFKNYVGRGGGEGFNLFTSKCVFTGW